MDECGTCDDDWTNDCLPDCNGVFNGTAQLDACDVCGGDGTSCAEVKDCNGNSYTEDASWAMADECGTCDTDWMNDCNPWDCNGGPCANFQAARLSFPHWDRVVRVE